MYDYFYRLRVKTYLKKLINKSEKYILFEYKNNFIFHLYNLIKKKDNSY